MIYSAFVSFIRPYILLEAKKPGGRSRPQLWHGLGRVLPRGQGTGEDAVSHEINPPLPVSSGVKAEARGCWRRGRVDAVARWAGLRGGELLAGKAKALWA